ncbi:MAG: hypothetical protein AAGG81_09295 [Chlamydiota bacterium]
MKKNLTTGSSKSTWLIKLLVLITLFSGLDAKTEEHNLSFHAEHNEKYQKKVEVIEKFLQTTVPGLDISYREVFDALIEEGQEIYIKGGLIRDLLSPNPQIPHDVDFVFSGTKEEILAVIHKHQWQHTTQPDYSLITIGDYTRICIEGVSKKGFLPTNEHQLEFTINNIFYHVNSRSFTNNSDESFEDLDYNRLRIQAKDWREWLYGSHGNYRYAKLFRVWKMIGKGYIYQINFESFIKDETIAAQENDSERFNEELLRYLGNHYESFGDISRGVLSVMGNEWQSEHLLPIEVEAEKKSHTVMDEMKEFTFFKKS